MEHRTTLSLEKTLVVGVDEAGRGSLVGDMFIAGVCIRSGKLDMLRDMGVRDSKQLTPQRREELFTIIINEVEYYTVRRVPPSMIDSRNLNDLLYENIADILLELHRKCKHITNVYIDLTGNKNRLLAFINRRIKEKTKWVIIAEHKADQKYVAVAIASIIAKVLRDKHIRELTRKFGEIGSGYPADPRTINWLRKYLEEHGELPPIVRRTWRTLKDIAPSHYIDKKKGDKTIPLDQFLYGDRKSSRSKSDH